MARPVDMDMGDMSRCARQELEQEQVELRTSRAKYTMPALESGDIAKVTYYDNMTDKKEASFQGIVLGVFNKGVMRSIELRNVVDGGPVEIRFPLLSPLIKDVQLLSKRAKHMRAKLYHLRDRPKQESLFDAAALARRQR